jgi:hypothetical protein
MCASIQRRDADTCVTNVKSTRALTAAAGGGGRGWSAKIWSRAAARSSVRAAHHSAFGPPPSVAVAAAKLPSPSGHAFDTLKGCEASSVSLMRWLFMSKPVAYMRHFEGIDPRFLVSLRKAHSRRASARSSGHSFL